MKWNEYTDGALRTESSLMPLSEEVASRGMSNRLFHAILGIATEVNELYDAIEHKPEEMWDNVNILEELSDKFWYLAIAFDDLKMTNMISNDLEHTVLSNEELTSKTTKYKFIKELRQQSAGCLDMSKKVLFYGHSVNVEELITSLIKQYLLIKDIIYLISMDEETENSVMRVNLAKLKQRFPDKFDGFKAKIRDLESERKILESI